MDCPGRPFSPPQFAAVPSPAPPPTTVPFPSPRPKPFSTTASAAAGEQPNSPVGRRNLHQSLPCLSLRNPNSSPSHPPLLLELGGGNKKDGRNSGGGGGGGSGGDWSNHEWWRWRDDGGGSRHPFLIFSFSRALSIDNDGAISSSCKPILLSLLSTLCCFSYFQFAQSEARTSNSAIRDPHSENEDVVWEVKRGKWNKLVADHFRDSFIVFNRNSSSSFTSSGVGFGESPFLFGIVSNLWMQCRDVCVRLMLPEGYPQSVTGDYMDYSLWRAVQGVAAQISGVLATQSLLYAVGLGKGAIPTAAAVNWVLKDGIGYLSKILLSKYGRHFDVHPKGWRLFADLLENAAYGMEILTPAFPHLFVPIGAVAGAGRSAAALIQAATRSCFFAGFAAQRNFAEVIAKGEAQGMVSKFIGIALGITLASYTQSSTSLALVSFGVVTWVHMFCNLKSYQAIQLRTLTPYRAGLVFSEYLLSGIVPSVKEVNAEEPLFPAVPLLSMKLAQTAESTILSSEAKDAAANIESRLQLGSKLSAVVENKEEAIALFGLYRNEGYILTEHDGNFCVILKESSTKQDMLKSLFHVSYLYWLERNAGIRARSTFDDCRPGGRLQISLDYVQREFNHVKNDGELAGWVTDGLIARPLAHRISEGFVSSTVE